MVVLLVAFLVVGCGTEDNNPLKSPHLSRDPQVRVTHAPTKTPTPTVTEASATATPVVAQLPLGPTVDNEQFLIDEIERLLNKIENRLDQTDINP